MDIHKTHIIMLGAIYFLETWFRYDQWTLKNGLDGYDWVSLKELGQQIWTWKNEIQEYERQYDPVVGRAVRGGGKKPNMGFDLDV